MTSESAAEQLCQTTDMSAVSRKKRNQDEHTTVRNKKASKNVDQNQKCDNTDAVKPSMESTAKPYVGVTPFLPVLASTPSFSTTVFGNAGINSQDIIAHIPLDKYDFDAFRRKVLNYSEENNHVGEKCLTENNSNQAPETGLQSEVSSTLENVLESYDSVKQ